jgi:hypothetical protein
MQILAPRCIRSRWRTYLKVSPCINGDLDTHSARGANSVPGITTLLPLRELNLDRDTWSTFERFQRYRLVMLRTLICFGDLAFVASRTKSCSGAHARMECEAYHNSVFFGRQFDTIRSSVQPGPELTITLPPKDQPSSHVISI